MLKSDRTTTGPVRNKLLASLSSDTFDQLRAKLKIVRLEPKQFLQERNTPVKAVYFLDSGWACRVISFADGFRVGVALIGREGMTGLCLLGSSPSELADTLVQVPGRALAVEAGDFRRALEALPELRHVLQEYQQVVREQAMQTAACNGHHSLEQRLARWLLMIEDRTEAGEMAVTQELLAMILCVHRPSVTVAAGRLQRAGLIRYAVRQATILDRPRLINVACECYAYDKDR